MSAAVQTYIREEVSVPRPRTSSLLPLLLLFAALKVALQLGITLFSQHAGYGIVRDELYYLVCGRHPAFGYVDQPPLVALVARASELIFGYRHLLLFRIPVYLAGALTVMLTGLLTQALGGGRRAAALAMFAAATTTILLGTQSFLSMNAFDPVFWMGALYAYLRLLAAPNAIRWWLLLGASAGLATENKASAVFFIVALLAAMVATPARCLLRERGFALAAAVCALLAAPNLAWQEAHRFPTWEWLRAVAHSSKEVVLTPPQFLIEQIAMLSPLHVLLWLPGLVWLLGAGGSRRWRSVGVFYLVFLVIMICFHAKDYYLAPVYPVLFAAGGIFWTEWAGRSRARRRFVLAYAGAVAVSVALVLPFAVPVLSPRELTLYSRAMHFQVVDSEQHPGATFPEFFADHLGWRELADGVERVWRSLPSAEQARTAIWAGNYGQASAIAVYGGEAGLPEPISGHQNYWLWGPRGNSGEEAIVVTDQALPILLRSYRSCVLRERQGSPYWMPWEQRGIYVCRGRVRPYAEDWARLKLYW